jgi:hypothetical protein
VNVSGANSSPPARGTCQFSGASGQCRNPGRWERNGLLSCTTHYKARDPQPFAAQAGTPRLPERRVPTVQRKQVTVSSALADSEPMPLNGISGWSEYELAPKTEILMTGIRVAIPRYYRNFERQWSHEFYPHVRKRYGAKRVIDWGGTPLFAELGCLRLLEDEGWRGMWIDDWGKRYWTELPLVNPPRRSAEFPPPALDAFRTVQRSWGQLWSGWWDLLVARGSDVLFAEVKWTDASFTDRWTNTQLPWLAAALSSEIQNARFAVIECSFRTA